MNAYIRIFKLGVFIGSYAVLSNFMVYVGVVFVERPDSLYFYSSHGFS